MEQLAYIVCLPLLTAVISLVPMDSAKQRSVISLLVWVQLAIVVLVLQPVLWGGIERMTFAQGLAIEHTGALFLSLGTFVVASSLSHGNVFFEKEGIDGDAALKRNMRLFYCCASLFLFAMHFVYLCDNLGYLWISIEATTLASAPLVYYARTRNSLEATWKFLIICSVGIAFALLGTVLIFAASQHGVNAFASLDLSALRQNATALDYSLLRLGFIFCLLGYGTKAGVFPLHSWLPDAHSEAPAPASAMLSGALLNCALFAIWRLSQLVLESGHTALALYLPLGLGTVTVLAGSLFLVSQYGLKRLWAYSSVENVGLMLTAIGLASAPLFFLQAANHSLSKVALFLLSGNIIQATGTKKLGEIRGLLTLSPSWAILLMLAAFAVTGAPPFGAFISEWLMLARSADTNLWYVVAVLLFALALSFIAVSVHVAHILWGTPKAHAKAFSPIKTSAVPALLIVATLSAGISSLPLVLLKLP
ncbi:MAG TPA: proton-conducting transporter membrane subunit [Candidatus Obscuribacterales bacterium]